MSIPTSINCGDEYEFPEEFRCRLCRKFAHETESKSLFIVNQAKNLFTGKISVELECRDCATKTFPDLKDRITFQEKISGNRQLRQSFGIDGESENE